MSQEWDILLNPLFKNSSDEELLPIVNVLLENFNNDLRLDNRYITHPKYPTKYIPAIVKDVKEFGGNTIQNLIRNEGVKYSTIVKDVADKLGIKYNKSDKIIRIEWKIITKIVGDAREKMTPNERANFDAIFYEYNIDIKNTEGLDLSKLLNQTGLYYDGYLSFTFSTIVANSIYRSIIGGGMRIATQVLVGRTMMLVNPVAFGLSTLWTIYKLTGPAYRTTIPLVFLIANLRMKKIVPKDLKVALKILGVGVKDSWTDIKKAFRDKMKIYHPDKIQLSKLDDKNTINEKAIELISAYDTVKKHYNR